MATPHVAGAVALLLDANPSLTPIQVKKALSNYAKDLGLNVLEQGSGRIDVCGAVNASLIGESSISFGRVNLSTSYTRIIVFQNLANNIVTVSLNVEKLGASLTKHHRNILKHFQLHSILRRRQKNVELSLNSTKCYPAGILKGELQQYLTVNIVSFMYRKLLAKITKTIRSRDASQ